MNNRIEANVLEEKKGINFTAEGEISGTLKINGEDCVRVYQKPPIPTGYEYLSGTKYEGWKIRRISDGSQAFWLPLESLNANGTLDGINFTEKFGRRMESDRFFEPMNGEIFDQIISYRRYGGIYIFEYPISINPHTNEPQSVATETPFKTGSIIEARRIARNMDTRLDGSVKSHLVYGAEWDSLLEWLKIANVTLDEIWYNHFNWTQEKYGHGSPELWSFRGNDYGKDLIGRRDSHYSSSAIIPVALTIQL